MKAGMLIAGFIVVKLLIALALQLVATFALPILLGIVVLAALFTVARFLTKNFGDKFQPTIDAIWNIFDTIDVPIHHGRDNQYHRLFRSWEEHHYIYHCS